MQQVIWGESILSLKERIPPGGILSCFVVDSIVLWVFLFFFKLLSNLVLHACMLFFEQYIDVMC